MPGAAWDTELSDRAEYRAVAWWSYGDAPSSSKREMTINDSHYCLNAVAVPFAVVEMWLESKTLN